ncbi:MAG: hypothetical protein UV73_C0001G0023 [Candidatus Gottesmanbacteria bacterium GW2011_GWA2_43_14]|uniref:Amidohydrolase-related domain-containing protein n=1 Tax=Candidatus Gottesmanbacteria bacterium GW2011_GWA2_43_14 TaxID=1618443 RepID=A0A0G1DLP2_9BACT|nr:MAG: hypothetical protein UV73_C0001G0023 [Candidatus Gottesmanbacteria bacterium GW2011_GWA2_43_14]
MSSLIRLPGLIDIHVHFRDPGQTHKEDFFTGSSAAVAGGVTAVFDMPNNSDHVTTLERLREKELAAENKAVCDYGLYFGTDGKNLDIFAKAALKTAGLKIYLGLTTGRQFISDPKLLERIFVAWPKEKVIVIHGEGDQINLAIEMAAKTGSKLHISHISTKNALEQIIRARKDKLALTCDVTPHHLFLNQEDGQKLGKLAQVKPPLATISDQVFLWQNISEVDCLATDHAPHTLEEKHRKEAFGFPGLETMLPLLLTAVADGKVTVKEIIRLTNEGPRKIFGINQEIDTYVEAESGGKYRIENTNLFTRCGWSPFDGWIVNGKVVKTVIRGQTVFENNKILVPPGFGRKIN